MKAGFSDVEATAKQTVIQLLDVQQTDFEIESMKIDFVFQNRMKGERVVRARGNRQSDGWLVLIHFND